MDYAYEALKDKCDNNIAVSVLEKDGKSLSKVYKAE